MIIVRYTGNPRTAINARLSDVPHTTPFLSSTPKIYIDSTANISIGK